MEGESFEQWKLVQSQAVLVRVQTVRTQCCSTIGRDSRKLCLYLAHRCRATHGSGFIDASKHDASFLRFLFNVYLSSFRRKVSKYVTVFGQRSFSFDFLRNKVSLQSIDVSKICVWSSLLPLSMEIRMKHTSKSLISFIRLEIEINIYIFVRHELSRDFAAL